jgi:hypothetical protein
LLAIAIISASKIVKVASAFPSADLTTVPFPFFKSTVQTVAGDYIFKKKEEDKLKNYFRGNKSNKN